MLYYKTEYIHLGTLLPDDVTKRNDGFPYLTLSDRLISRVNQGAIVVLDCKDADIPHGFINAHPNAASWHRDTCDGIAGLYKPEIITREAGTDFVTIDEDLCGADERMYPIDPPIDVIRTIDYGDPAGKIVFWTNRAYTKKDGTMNVTRRVLHRRSKTSLYTEDGGIVMKNPLLFYGTFANKEGKKLFINSDF